MSVYASRIRWFERSVELLISGRSWLPATGAGSDEPLTEKTSSDAGDGRDEGLVLDPAGVADERGRAEAGRRWQRPAGECRTHPGAGATPADARLVRLDATARPKKPGTANRSSLE